MEQHKQLANPQPGTSNLFVLNVWEAASGSGHTEWRGEILDVDSGVAHSFDDWPELVDLIAATLHKLRPLRSDPALRQSLR